MLRALPGDLLTRLSRLGVRIALLGIVAVAGCMPGTSTTSTAPLDYSDPGEWAALPWTQDAADQTPSPTLKDRQSEAVADVFFVHPTTYLSLFGWNAATDDKRLNNLTAKGPIRLQASAFNGCCRVFAPRYRQAALKTFVRPSAKGRAAMALAYSDVRDAFGYYLQHFNQGRPFIIASHSQGSVHARRLLAEVVDPDPELRRRLVAAYLVGCRVACAEFKHIPVCEQADQTGCFVNWRSYIWGTAARDKGRGGSSCCTNPLTWHHDDTYAPKALNLGGTPYTFDRLDPGVADAQCVDGRLWVHEPDRHGYVALGHSFHLMDYNLFYENIRENAETRVRAFLKEERLAPSPAPRSPVGH